ncbi:hypothetical protein [Filomicrobium insigne]|nr:hypothetical protein [Filomicrobium insigne]
MAHDDPPDDLHLLHIDAHGVLRHRIELDRMPAPGQPWRVEGLAAKIPWRIPISVNEASLYAGLAVLRAHEDARAALNRVRGRREREHMARYGPLNLRDPVAALERGEESTYTTVAGGDLAAALGVTRRPDEDAASFAARVREAGRSGSGRAEAADVRAFIESLANWWWRQTHRRPNGRTSAVSARADRTRRRPVTFLEFVEAAFQDAGGRGSIARSVRTVLDELNRGDPLPPWTR